MKKYMITITALLENEASPTLVLDISPDSVLVNCPKSSGIEIEALRGESHLDLFCKLPESEEEFHFQCTNLSRREKPRQIENAPGSPFPVRQRRTADMTVLLSEL